MPAARHVPPGRHVLPGRPPLAQDHCLAIVAFALLVLGCEGAGDAPSPDAPTPEQIAASLPPAIQIEGEPPEAYDLRTRMEYHEVPGVSVAVLDGGEIVWARGWGLPDGETDAPVTPATLFQAASISKPVAALAAMSLVEEGRVALDGPVNAHLTGWQVPDNELTADSAVTLRRLLTHTAGLTVSGFPGYRKDRPFAEGRQIATNVEVLDGLGNTDPVRVFRRPGTAWRYSGGGYTVMEEMLENVTGLPFPEVMRTRVLEPAGMSRSTYEQPLPRERWDEAAHGHRGDGSEVEGEWHNYPEQAAAGLWTTPTDLLELSRHLLAVLDGSETEGVVGRGTLEAMLTPHRPDEEEFESYGLGFGIEGEADGTTFGHGGSNAGFRARWLVFRHLGQGAAIMTNGARGGELAEEILRSLAVAYDWPRLQPEVRARRLLDADALAAYVDEYAPEPDPDAEPGTEPEIVVSVRAGDGVLLLDVPGEGTYTLHAEVDEDDAFFIASDASDVRFERDGDGSVEAMVFPGEIRLVRR